MDVVALSKFVSLLIIQIVAIFGNLLMIIVGLKCKSLRKYQNSFIFNLAFADLLQGLVIMTSALINVYKGRWILGHTTCEVFGILKVTLTLSSVYSLSGTSVLRYFYVVKRTKRMNTMRKAVSCIACSWVISISLAMTPLFNWGVLGFEDGKDVCTVLFHLTTSHTLVVFVTGLFLNVVIMVVCYICIFLKLRHTNQRIRVNSALSGKSGSTNRSVVSSSSLDAVSTTITELSPELTNNNNNEQALINSKFQNSESEDDYKSNDKSTVISNSKIRLDCYHQQPPSGKPHVSSSSLDNKNKNSSTFLDYLGTQRDSFIGKSHVPLSKNRSVDIYQQQPQQKQYQKKTFGQTRVSFKSTSKKLFFLGKQTAPSLSPGKSFLGKQASSCSSLTSSSKRRTTSFTNGIPKTEMNLLKTICTIVVVFICCWTPYVSFNMIRMFGWSADNNTVDTITMWLGFINSAINPVIYGVMNRQFRNAMWDILTLRTSRCTNK